MMSSANNSPGPPPPGEPAGPLIAVRLQLDGLYPHPEHAPQTSVADGWDLTGPVRAIAHGKTWIRSARGMWLVQCTFDIKSADGRRSMHLGSQLVPAHLLRVLE